MEFVDGNRIRSSRFLTLPRLHLPRLDRLLSKADLRRRDHSLEVGSRCGNGVAMAAAWRGSAAQVTPSKKIEG